MKQKILGLDLGTNSIGISIRNTQISGTVDQQIGRASCRERV